MAEQSSFSSGTSCASCAVSSDVGEILGASEQKGKISVQERARAIAQNRPAVRAVFMGTPGFAATILQALLDSALVDVVAVYTQPDRPAGRGKALKAPEVKLLAEARGLPVHQPLNFRKDDAGNAAFEKLAAYAPDVLIVAAYGLILPQRVLDIPRLLPVNVHASLLPRYRGAAPIQRALMNGDAVTGVTIMKMEAGLDTGPILLQRAVGIDCNDTSASLHDELATAGSDLLLQALERLAGDALHAIPQDETKATYAAKLLKEESLLDFSSTCVALHAYMRGITPWPGGAMILHRLGCEPMLITVSPAHYPFDASLKEKGQALLQIMPECSSQGVGCPPETSLGRILGVIDDALLVSCADGFYAFQALRPSAKKAMDGKAFYNGYLAGHEGAFFAGASRKKEPSRTKR